MSCLAALSLTLPALLALGMFAKCALILGWIAKRKRFSGKAAFLVTLGAMLWWLTPLGFELATQSPTCKLGWSMATWPAIVLMPLAWAFFVFDYTRNAYSTRRPLRQILFIAVPTAVAVLAATNGQTQLLFTVDQTAGGSLMGALRFGPAAWVVTALLYGVVLGTLGMLFYAFGKADAAARPFLGVLIMITASPVPAHLAHVVWDITLFGFDPTPFMFCVALIWLSWLLVNNPMMDIEAQGRGLLYYATKDPVLLTDARGRFASANHAAELLFAGELPRVGGRLTHLAAIQPILNDLRGPGVLSSDDQLHVGDRVFEPKLQPITSPIRMGSTNLGWVIVLGEVTEREAAAAALRDAVDEAESATQAKSQFLAMVSHELRTPMTSVRGGLELALSGQAGEMSDQLRNLLVIAKRNSLRLTELIEGVLDLQKLDLQELNLFMKDLDADAFLSDLVEEYEGYARQAGVRVEIISPSVDEVIHADENRLKQVVGNVISNAVKFSPEGGTVTCRLERRGQDLRLSVTDQGVGIPEGSEDKVFGRFNQVAASAAKVAGGSGLGLHIAKLLVELMGGAISYASRAGEGATFYVDLPVPQAANADLPISVSAVA